MAYYCVSMSCVSYKLSIRNYVNAESFPTSWNTYYYPYIPNALNIIKIGINFINELDFKYILPCFIITQHTDLVSIV